MQTGGVYKAGLTIKGKADVAELKPLQKQKRSPAKKLKQEEAERQKRLSEPKISKIMNRTIRLEVDRELNEVVAKVIDKDTGEVIRQIPPEELLRIAKSLKEQQAGILLNREA